MNGKPTETAPCGCPVDEGLARHQRGQCADPVVRQLGWYFPPAAVLDVECRRIGEARAAGYVTGAEAGRMAALACLLHGLGVVTP